MIIQLDITTEGEEAVNTMTAASIWHHLDPVEKATIDKIEIAGTTVKDTLSVPKHDTVRTKPSQAAQCGKIHQPHVYLLWNRAFDGVIALENIVRILASWTTISGHFEIANMFIDAGCT